MIIASLRAVRHPEVRALASLEGWSRAVALRGPLARPPPATTASPLRGGDGEKCERGASRPLVRQAEPLPHAGVRVGILRDVADHRNRIRARGKDLRSVLELDAADGDQR